MSVNTFKEDEYQKEVLKKDTLLRLYRYLLAYTKQIALVFIIMAVTIAGSGFECGVCCRCKAADVHYGKNVKSGAADYKK